MTTYAAITGWGKCLPPAVLSNHDLAGMLETSDEWITSRTGIRERRVSHVPMADMAHVAAERALACAGVSGRDIELIVFGTCSFEDQVPNMASGLQQAFRVMRDQSPQGGRIINNGSISAHAPRPNSAAYTATKHGVMGLTKTAALDGRANNIAVGQIDIGNAMTDLAARMAKGVPQAHGEIAVEPLMDVEVVAQSVLYMANLPLEANVLFHTVMATKMPFVGRG